MASFTFSEHKFCNSHGSMEVFYMVDSCGNILEAYPCRENDKEPSWANELPTRPQWLADWMEEGECSMVAFIKGSRKVKAGYYPLVDIIPAHYNGSFKVSEKAVIKAFGRIEEVSSNCCKNWTLDHRERLAAR